MASNRQSVIVGASLAGAKAAETLREEGFDGRIILLGAEPARPYERPALSKEYLRGESTGKPFVHAESFYAERDIELRTATPVASIDAPGSEVVLDGGERVPYDALLLTTGSAVRRLSVPGADLDGIHYLRELDDADAIRARIEAAGRLVVIGAGWIGAEVAASARAKGVEVTIVEMGSVPLERVLGREVGAIYADVHRDNGVELVTDARLEAFEGAASVERVRLADGRTIECDFVVAGIGVTPRSGLAEAAGIEVDNGIVVSDRLQTSRPGVFAAGDVANAQHPFYGRRIRVEHWANALHQGPHAARSMLGRDDAYDRLPYFYSDQYDVGMEYSGHAVQWDEVVLRGDPAGREFIAFWLDAGRLVAGMNVNVWDVTEPIQALIRSGDQVDVARLRDPDVALEELAVRAPLRDPRRSGGGSSLGQVLRQGMTFPRRFIGDRLSKGDPTPVSDLPRGEGRILQVGGEKVAVHRDEAGAVHAVSPVCTHVGCHVDWNSAESTWDCPCHGSRFGVDGAVIQGPAKRELARRDLGAGAPAADRDRAAQAP